MDDSTLMTTSMATSSGFSDDNNYGMDEDVLYYLSTLTPHQQRMLEDFVSFNDHSRSAVSQPPAVDSMNAISFAYGNSVGANQYFGRPVSMYEPQIENEFSSLPPDLISSNDPNSGDFETNVNFKYSYEAEDAEYIETLNEMRDNFNEHQSMMPTMEMCNKLTFTADVHCDDERGKCEVEYATVQKPKKHLRETHLGDNL
jgi:hypothetical protein